MSVLTITKTTVMTNATASDSKYKYTVTYQVTETSKTLESVSVSVNDVSNNSYIGKYLTLMTKMFQIEILLLLTIKLKKCQKGEIRLYN